MYNTFKKIAKKIIPKKILFKYEYHFRKLFHFKYKGDNYQCNICKSKLKEFVILKGKDLLCPACGSRSRTRRLWHILQQDITLQGNVLDFSPARILYQKHKQNKNIHYFATDFANEFIADFNYDITAIPHNDNFFDFIICYHVLEHIENDHKAIAELFRVLKPTGICILQTPFKDGEIYEDFSITTPSERLKAFGQNDHVRIYSREGLKNRLEKEGFQVNIKMFSNAKNVFNGFQEETVLFAKK